MRAAAGEDWDGMVAACVARGLGGIECLSGIPGLVGATPIQNVGAYGQEVAETIAAVHVLDRQTGEQCELAVVSRLRVCVISLLCSRKTSGHVCQHRCRACRARHPHKHLCCAGCDLTRP